METAASLIEELQKYPPTTPIKFWMSETEQLNLLSIYPNDHKTKPCINIDMEYE